MSPGSELSITAAAGYWKNLPPFWKAGVIAAGLLALFLFAGLYGSGNKEAQVSTVELKPYRPAGAEAKESRSGVAGKTEGNEKLAAFSGDFPRPPGPEVEPAVVEEIKGLKKELSGLKESVASLSDKIERGEKVETIREELGSNLKELSSELREISRKMKREERDLKEQAPITLVAIVSSGGINYAVLLSEAGEKRVTEGDKIGPWLVEEIGLRKITLSAGRQKRTLELPAR